MSKPSSEEQEILDDVGKIKSRKASEAYKRGWDRVFGKKAKKEKK